MDATDSATRHEAVFDPATDGGRDTRLDVFWSVRLAGEDVTRARVRAVIENGGATVAGAVCRKPGTRLRGGEALVLLLPKLSSEAEAEAGALSLLYADADVVVLDKPAGLTVHPAPGLPEGTLVNRLLYRFPQLRDMAGERPGIVHRLDKDTSGLLLVALTESARQTLAADFAARRVHKTYLALVHGRPERVGGEIRLPIGRDPRHRARMAVAVKGGREAVSRWRLVWSAPDSTASLLEVDILTGRTHQIRVHLAAIGHPIVGDAVYGAVRHTAWKRRPGVLARLATRQMLHAWKLSFTHPGTGKACSYRCPPPPDFWRLALLLGRRCQRVGLVGMPGCGKSALLTVFEAAGYPVFSADAAVGRLYAPGGGGAHMLAGRFGEKALAPDGAVDKKWLLARMLESESFRREVMELVHPLVRAELDAFWEEHAACRAAVAEVPLLFESGWPWRDVADVVVGVRCSPQTRRGRLTGGRGWSGELADRMDGWQWSEEAKLAKCGFVVDNDGDLSDLARRGGEVLAGLAAVRRRDAREHLDWLRERGYAPEPGEKGGEAS